MNERLPESPLIVESHPQVFGFAETALDPLELSERVQGRPQIEAQIDRLLQCLASLGHMPLGCQRLLEATHRLPVSRSRQCLLPSLTEVRDCLFPYLTSYGVVSQSLDVLDQPVRIEAFDGANDASMQSPAPFVEQRAVSDFMGERVLE